MSSEATDDLQADVLEELTDARRRLLTAAPETIVVNHAIGLYEFAALQLSSSPPNLVSAVLAIDALACLVEGLAGRLGEDESTLHEALSNIRLAFVQIKASTTS